MGKLKEAEFDLYNENGDLMRCKGGYFIVDGGYQKYPCFVDPMHSPTGHHEVHWSEFLESVRKDVECTFGILKARFRYLRNGLKWKSVKYTGWSPRTLRINIRLIGPEIVAPLQRHLPVCTDGNCMDVLVADYTLTVPGQYNLNKELIFIIVKQCCDYKSVSNEHDRVKIMNNNIERSYHAQRNS